MRDGIVWDKIVWGGTRQAGTGQDGTRQFGTQPNMTGQYSLEQDGTKCDEM